MIEIDLTTDEVGAVCDRLAIGPPVGLAGSDVMRVGDPDRADRFAEALAGLEARGVALDPAAPLAAGLRVLAEPTTLVTALRQLPGSSDAGFFGIVAEVAAEHRPVGADDHVVAVMTAAEVIDRVAGFCRLVERDDAPVGPVAMTADDFLAAGEQVSAGNVEGAARRLRGCGTEESVARFLAALAGAEASCQVTVTFASGASRIEGTTTAWIDGGEAGLWRLPTLAMSSPFEGDRADTVQLQAAVLRVEPTSRADLLDEVTDGVPGLG